MPACYPLARAARAWACCLTLAALAAAPSVAQAAYGPAFDVELAAGWAEAAGGLEPRLDVYTAVPNPSLRFLARDGGFEATYAVTVQVYARDDRGRRGRLVVSRTSERAVAAGDYDATQDAGAGDWSVLSLAVPPGRYAVEVAVEDGSSGRAASRELDHAVRDAAGGVAVSDPVLFRSPGPAAGPSEPMIGATVSTEDEAFWASYDLHAGAARGLEVTYLVTERGRVRERPSFGALLGLAPREQAELGTPVAVTEPVDVGPGRTPVAFRIATGALQVGDYTLTVRVADAQGETLASVDKPFAVRWTGLDSQIADLDQAIAQLRYVAKDDEYRAIRDAPSPEEQRRRFLAFWDGRDPTPGTARNEEMETYYHRVAHANERYSRLHDRGWSTDRGEIFIVFGEPDAVEERAATYGTRTVQIWSYYGQGRRFMFHDDTGTGDFRLLVPRWDPRTRM